MSIKKLIAIARGQKVELSTEPPFPIVDVTTATTKEIIANIKRKIYVSVFLANGDRRHFTSKHTVAARI
jgi:hypothetical protein